MRITFLFTLLLCIASRGFAQSTLLQSGPMLGYSAMREVFLWVQTKSEATVHFEYWEKGKPQSRAKTDKVVTQKIEGFTARITATDLVPSTKYEYEVFINGKKVERPYPLEFQTQTLWQYRTDPPNFKFAFGSCHYVNEPPYDRPGTPYGGEHEIFKEIAKQKPDLMVWGGDNTYLREVDYDSRSGMIARYTHTRSVPEMQALLGATHHLATWDDHDYGPNDADRSFIYKDQSTDIFKLFWGNPNYGVGTNGKGISGKAAWADVEFFILDNRYFKSPNDRTDAKKELLGDQQIEWLIDALAESRATFKFIVMGVQALNSAAMFENYSTCPEEKTKLLGKIRENKIRGVVFLTGDRHHSVLSMLKESDRVYPIYDFTISPFTSGVHAPHPEENNALAVPNTLVTERNFAVFEVTGATKERVLKVSVINVKGEVKWTKEIAAKDLR
jgi:alkaline phosphatase D